RPKAVIATSGTAAALAAVCHGLYKTKAPRASTVSRAQMRRIAKMLARLPIEKRRQLSGVGPRRAEIIVAGAVVYAELLERCQLRIEYAEWLSAAAMLYEVGDYVNRNGRHRHTYYIIANSEILGYTPQQRRIIAAIARYLGKSRPAPGDAVMKNLIPADRESVRKASLLLRLARALNLGRTGAVRQTRVYARDGAVNVRLEAKPRASVDLELWAVEKEKSYFREVFGRELSAATL